MMRVCPLLVFLCLLCAGRAQKFSALTFLRVDQDKECNMECTGAPRKPLCASDGRTFTSRCEFLRAKCRDPQLEVIRGPCKDTSRCVAEKKYTEQQAKKLFPQVFVPVCNPDGTYSEVQCHSYTGYCWCVTPNGRPISGSAVANKKPRCQGSKQERATTREPGKAVSLQIFSILNADETGLVVDPQPAADEEDIISQYPTLWTEQVRSRQNNRTRAPSSSCDQEQQSAQEEARQHKNDAVFVPDCALGGLYKPVQCHPSTGYCWCVLVDTGRPIPGTSTRYEQPKCDGNARAHPTKPKDHYRSRHLQGCPGAKKTEFLTSVLDALSTDMVHAVTDPASAGRMAEPDPSHTLEERVVHWYFSQLDKNSSGDIGKKEIKPFKRFLRKKSKPKKCVKKFVEYCDISNDKALSLQELMGCLGVTKEEGAKPGEGLSSSKLNQSKKQG
ncbi:SPARC-related modular calcium-binding protein 2 isoform X2 [Hippoglossus hippoglossus]|uniref:SPARC-related modular calcium-binding protein 2 isoform X2 n=1 Tax=Hippoglossus hippoglossus TaxID=8267 RepID=UPI00148E5530|nr:SPARC-related modular calcium-binding protein 2 isoform X2 [Hippoglossus hippoglossus]XP_035028878.1 SPARC-related modular calcium-binding protein 2 isoform X1 [Hippoglossus stenolepis]